MLIETMEENTAKTKRKDHNDRKLEILRALVTLIGESKNGNITTKALAARLGLSEAALYRHFSGKNKMYEEIIDFAEKYISSWINKITSEEPSGVAQAKILFKTLSDIENSEPGLVALLCGESLQGDIIILQQKINRIYQLIEIAFKQSLQFAVANEELPARYDAELRARLLATLVLGDWLQSVKHATPPSPLDKVKEATVIIGR